MDKILYINACVRPESRTRKLAEIILERLHGEVEEVNLEKEHIKPLTKESLDYRDKLLEEGIMEAPDLSMPDSLVKRTLYSLLRLTGIFHFLLL